MSNELEFDGKDDYATPPASGKESVLRLAQKWTESVLQFMPVDMFMYIIYQKKAFIAGYTAAKAATPIEQSVEPPFPDKMSFEEMYLGLFNRDFLSDEEFQMICDAAEMYANGCLKQAATSLPVQPEVEKAAKDIIELCDISISYCNEYLDKGIAEFNSFKQSFVTIKSLAGFAHQQGRGAATPGSREDGYWQKRCEAAEALIKKHYKSIPDSPTYMAWQNSIEPDPDSREEGKGDLMDEWKTLRTKAISEMFDNVSEGGIYPTTKFFETIDKWVSEHIPAPVTDKGVDVKFYLRKNDSVSDAVDDKFEFIKWIGRNGYTMHQVNDRWYDADNYIGGTEYLYTIFLTQKQKV